MKKTVLIVTALFVSLSFSKGAAAVRTMQLDDLKSLTGVSDATISPDGTQIAYILSKPDYKTDKTERTLMLYDLRANAERALSFERKGVASPAWSPDGTRIAFLSARGQGKDAQEQIFVLNMHGGDPLPITKASEGVQQFAWRPDGKAIAYVTADEPANKKDLEHHLDAFVVGDQSYTETEAPTPNHIWLIDADGSANTRLTQGAWSLPPAAPPGR